MRLKLVLLLLCLVAITLTDVSKKSVKLTKEKLQEETEKQDPVVIKSLDELEDDAGADDEEIADEETETPEKTEKPKKIAKKGKSGKDTSVSKKDKKVPRKSKKSEVEEKVKEAEEEDEDDNEYQACNFDSVGDGELCHCDMDEINCSAIVMDSDDPHLKTMDLSIKKKDFKPRVANFSSNGIVRLLSNKVLPGNEKYVSVLDVSFNQVRFADKDVFKPFTNLTKLDLSHNNLQTVKKPVFDAVGKTLHRLDLGYNRIKQLTDSVFDGLTNLKILILDGNPIKKWSKEFFKGLDSLQQLSLDGCNITELPADLFEYLPKLVGVSIRGNPLEEIPAVIANLKTLKDVDMSETSLTEIRDHAFAGDSDLEEIILEKMPFLSVVRDCGFCGLPKLKTLLLNDNKGLVEIHPNAFGFIKSEPGHKATAITEFAIHNSNVSTLSEHMLNYDKIETFKIGGNPWNCDCETQFLLEEKFSFKQDSIAPKCRYPEPLKDRHLATVRVTDACEDARFLGRSGRFSSVLGIGLLVAFIAIGLFYLHSSGKLAKLVRQVRKEPEVSYSNLQNGEDFALEADFQPRPAEV